MINKIKENIYQLCFNDFGSCVYLLKLNKNILIDTSSKQNQRELVLDLNKLKIKPKNIQAVLLTHSHWDHIDNLDLFKNAEIYSSKNISKLERNFPEIKVIETPGHTKDSISFLYKDVLFSGDTVFYQGYGRTDFPESSPREMNKSLEKIARLNYKILCPGHI